jgi:Zn-dependent metalloprotease
MEEPPRYCCVCFALPSRLLEHAARKVGGEHGARLMAHAAHSARLRGARATKAAAAAPLGLAGARAGKELQRVFDARNGTKVPGWVARKEGAGAADDQTVNHAYDNVGITLDFFAKVCGRRSLDGRGMRVDSTVHYRQGFANAMWNGKQMLFGDGDGVNILGFAQSLDIVAHELMHAVTQRMVPGGLGESHEGKKVTLTGQAGALNESFSDVFASMVKQWHGGEDVKKADWLLGEGVLAPHIGRAVRSLAEPGNTARTYDDDDQPGDMAGYVPGGDAHTNSGIPNHAFYLAAKALGGHSWERAGKIWFEALGQLHSRADFTDAASATDAAAARLFGAGSREREAVQAAWRKVKVIK